MCRVNGVVLLVRHDRAGAAVLTLSELRVVQWLAPQVRSSERTNDLRIKITTAGAERLTQM